MGLKTETRRIGEVDVTVTQFAAMRAFGLLARLGRAVGPALGAAAGLNSDDDVSALTPVLAELFARLDAEEAQGLARDLLAGSVATKDGKQFGLVGDDNINMAFGGDARSLLAAVIFAVEVNFGSFFDVPGASQEASGAGSRSTSTVKRRKLGPPTGSG